MMVAPSSGQSSHGLAIVELELFLKTFYNLINLEDCGIDPVSRGIALGFERVAKGSDARIIDVSRICFDNFVIVNI